jgi:PleD family two-component response regulator
VVLVQGEDFVRRAEILDDFNRRVEENIGKGEVVVSAGMAEYEPTDEQLYVTFHRADQRMYARKAELKQLGACVRE